VRKKQYPKFTTIAAQLEFINFCLNLTSNEAKEWDLDNLQQLLSDAYNKSQYSIECPHNTLCRNSQANIDKLITNRDNNNHQNKTYLLAILTVVVAIILAY
jgi:hypothetical protein